jgi:PAS domain S-box-containing protein
LSEKQADLDFIAELRRRAVDSQGPQWSSVDLAALSQDDIQRAFHELHVHQIELQMQNDELRQTQEALVQSRERYFDLFDAAPVGYVRTSQAGLLQEVNLAVVKMLGVPRTQLVGQPLGRYVYPGHSDIYYRHRMKCVEIDGRCLVEMQMVGADSGPFWVRLETARSQDAQGIFYNSVITDVNEARLATATLNQSEQRYRALFEQATEGILLMSMDGYLIEVNEAFSQMHGYRQEEFKVAHIQDLDVLGPMVMKGFSDLSGLLEAGQVVHLDVEHWHRNGSIVSLEVATSRVRLGRESFYLALHRDVTASKAERALLEARSKDLAEKNAELERFVYSISHDLKSPLVTVRTFLGYLQRDILTSDADGVAQDIDFVLAATEKMARILDELLQWSRVGHGVVPHEDVSLQAVVAEVLQLLSGPISARGVVLDVVDEPFVLVGDRARLVEVFLNLVDNAVKHMGDQPTPRVVVGVESSGDQLVFFVRDNGIGIDSRYKERIFNLFEKLDPDSGGSGVGLALVKRIVEVHGGRIWMESAGPGQGSTFFFTLYSARRRGAMEPAR